MKLDRVLLLQKALQNNPLLLLAKWLKTLPQTETDALRSHTKLSLSFPFRALKKSRNKFPIFTVIKSEIVFCAARP